MGVELDWSLNRPADIVGNVLAGYEHGRQMRTQRETDNALRQYATDPAGGTNALIQADPRLGISVRNSDREAALAASRFNREDKAAGRADDQAVLTRQRQATVDVFQAALAVPDGPRRHQVLADAIRSRSDAWEPGQIEKIAQALSSPQADTSDQNLRAQVLAHSGDPDAGAVNYTPNMVRRDRNGVVIGVGASEPVVTGNLWHQPELPAVGSRQGDPSPAPTAAPGMAAPPAGGAPGGAAGPAQPVSYQPPVNGPVTSGFGHRERPTAGATSDHHGIDFGVPVGTPVAAAAGGTVIPAPAGQGGLGNSVWIRHPDGSTTIYGHLEHPGPAPGTQVQAGENIGQSGATGTVTGPNLHFEYLDAQGHPRDPRPLLHPAGAAPATGDQSAPGGDYPPGYHPLPDTPAQRRQAANDAERLQMERRRLAIAERGGHEPTATDRQRHPNVDWIDEHGRPQYAPASAGSGTPTLSHDAIESAAAQYLLDHGSIRNISARGGSGAANRDAIINRSAEMERETGSSGADTYVRTQGVHAASQALSRQTNLRTTVAGFTRTFDQNASTAIQLAGRGTAGGPPVINRWIQAGRRSISGDADVAAFDAAVRTVASEYAKISEGNTGAGGSSVEARRAAEELLNANMTPEQFRRVIGVMTADNQHRIAGMDQGITELRTAIRGGGGTPDAPAAATPRLPPPETFIGGHAGPRPPPAARPALRTEADTTPRARTRPASPDRLPTAAVSALRDGHNTTFGNGQVWTLRGGRPVRVQ